MDFFDDIASWFGDGGDFVDNWDPGVMGDSNAFGLIDWSNIPGWDMPNDMGDGSGANWGNGSNPNWGLGDHSGDGADGSGGSSGGSGGGSSSLWSQIARLFGGSNGGGTNGGNSGGLGGGIGNLLALLALGGGGINQNNNINDATDAMLNANRDATDFLRGQLGSTSDRFKPYTDAGAGAISRIQAMPPSNIAAGFGPLGSGRGIKLAQLAKGR